MSDNRLEPPIKFPCEVAPDLSGEHFGVFDKTGEAISEGWLEEHDAKWLCDFLNDSWNRRPSIPGDGLREALEEAKHLLDLSAPMVMKFALTRPTLEPVGLANMFDERYEEWLKKVTALTQSPGPERDMTPEEALAEARKRWGPLAYVSSTSGPAGTLVTVAEKAIGGKIVQNSPTFREAFAKADQGKGK